MNGKISPELTVLESLSKHFPRLSGTGRAKVLLN